MQLYIYLNSDTSQRQKPAPFFEGRSLKVQAAFNRVPLGVSSNRSSAFHVVLSSVSCLTLISSFCNFLPLVTSFYCFGMVVCFFCTDFFFGGGLLGSVCAISSPNFANRRGTPPNEGIVEREPQKKSFILLPLFPLQPSQPGKYA
jgi:hypothetical protein